MKTNALTAIGFLAVVCSITTAQDSRHILDASSVRGGLVVVIGCERPALLAELRAGDSYLVHGLDHDPEKVAAARGDLRAKGIYGPVTAARWDGAELPYVESLVNLIVVSSEIGQISQDELRRVLAPGGVAIFLQSPASGLSLFRKPWPAELDEWSHFLHDASNNAVSNDTVVGPPQGLRWTCGPEYARSHEHFASMSAMVSAGGRVFYIIDEGSISSVYLPPQWKLVARDAFSGVLLWERPIMNWESHLRGFRSGPPEIGRRMVATDDRVYAALGYGEPVTVLDAATGESIWKQGFEAPGEILPATMAIDAGRVCLQTISHVVCLDATSGKEAWRSSRSVARSRLSWSTPTLVIHAGVVLTLDRAVSDNVGKSLPARGSEWIISGGGFEDREDAELVAISLDDGKELWRAAYSENYNTAGDVFVIDGVVWVGNLRAGGDLGFTQGRDLKTGEVTATIPPQKAWGHHRCYRNKATVNWLMVGRGGIQFVDPRSGAVRADSWYRGECQYGVMPANGLVYVPQHSCACQPEELLIGLNALAPQSSAGEGSSPLVKGPAYNKTAAAGLQPPASSLQPTHDWPTYRCDVRRSGYQDLAAPPKPGVAWTTRLSTPITAPVVAGGLVFVAETDHHTLHALSAADGKPTWTFLANGRIDSPPTLS